MFQFISTSLGMDNYREWGLIWQVLIFYVEHRNCFTNFKKLRLVQANLLEPWAQPGFHEIQASLVALLSPAKAGDFNAPTLKPTLRFPGGNRFEAEENNQLPDG